eukprot:scaffold67137_cov44-Prasinocladus_malaysianus.AAC.1
MERRPTHRSKMGEMSGLTTDCCRHLICYTLYHIHYPEHHLSHNHVWGPSTVHFQCQVSNDPAACSAVLHFGVIEKLAWVEGAIQ